MRRLLLTCFLLVIATSSGTAHAAGWSVMQARNGAPVARLETGDPLVPVVELACDGNRLAIGVQARAPTNVRALPVIFAGSDGRSVSATLPRIGQVTSFAGTLPDFALAQGLDGTWTTLAMMVGNRRLNPTLAGAPVAVRSGLAQCYTTGEAIATAHSTGSAQGFVSGNSQLFADASLPSAIRQDLADYASGCDYDLTEAYERVAARRGPALVATGALQRVDLNGDGIEDYVLDSAKLRCSRPLSNSDAEHAMLLVYTSTGQSFVHSLDVPYDSWKIATNAKGKTAGLSVHQNFVPEDKDAIDGEGEAVPLVNETIVMTGPEKWGKSALGQPDWRLGKLAAYPQALRDQFATWDRQCAATGHRLDFADEIYGAGTINSAGDLNHDGREDFVIDTTGLKCGAFEVGGYDWPHDAKLPYFCGRSCDLLAVVSGPAGAYAVDRLEGSISMSGNGDPAFVDEATHTIRWTGWTNDKCTSVVVSYTGTTQKRSAQPCS